MLARDKKQTELSSCGPIESLGGQERSATSDQSAVPTDFRFGRLSRGELIEELAKRGLDLRIDYFGGSKSEKS